MVILSFLNNPILLIAWLVAIIIALSVHEFSHALMSTMLGDNTAKYSGRLTLNPKSHISGIGFLMLLLVGFGWGKPVPYNPYNLKYPRFGAAFVALAGPISNILMVIFFGIVLKVIVLFGLVGPENLLVQFLNLLIVINVILAIFNLLPIPPLDGSKVLFSIFSDIKYADFRNFLETRGPYILLILLILDNFFNLGIFSSIFNFIINLVYKFLL